MIIIIISYNSNDNNNSNNDNNSNDNDYYYYYDYYYYLPRWALSGCSKATECATFRESATSVNVYRALIRIVLFVTAVRFLLGLCADCVR